MSTGKMTPPLESLINLDALRGWSENRDPLLRGDHHLEALAELVLLGRDDGEMGRYPIYGPDVLLGRFQSQYAPVDLHFDGLEDHQLYRLGAPHAHLYYDQGKWQMQVLTPRSTTDLNEGRIEDLHISTEISDGDILTFGVTRFRFHTSSTSLADWNRRRSELLAEVDEPALFLKRNGGPCGPFRRLSEAEPLVLGRTFPGPGILAGTEGWPERDRNFWDLSGLYDYERRFIAFRHAVVALDGGRWTIEPLSARQRTFVNRIAISGKIALEGGDEIALGSLLIRFHHPHRTFEPVRPHYDVPGELDWSEGRTPSERPGEDK